VWHLACGNQPVKLGAHERRRVHHGDIVEIGAARFQLKMAHASAAVHPAAATARAAMLVLAIFCTCTAGAQPRLSRAAGPSLLKLQGGAEVPVFSAQFNILDASDQPAPVPVIQADQARTGFRVTEDGRPLRVCSASIGKLPQRFAILLVDISGSMLEKVTDGRTKFAVAQEACLRFAATSAFETGIDHIAVIPFHSRGVVAGIRGTPFAERVADLKAAVADLPLPRSGNTGLYSAVIEALTRLREKTKNYPDGSVRTLLAVLTDGRNDVRTGDDPGLERRLEPVVDAVANAGIQTITVGFGNDVDEDVLQRIAWPSGSNYFHAEDPDQVVQAFEKARAFQVERLEVVFRPSQKRISQLITPHRFVVSFQNMKAELAWAPRPVNVAEGVVDCQIVEDATWTTFALVLFAGTLLHWLAWRHLPRRIWGGRYDRDISRKRLEESWPL
jgi:Mg-chelatase subunit ChlD